MVGRTRDEVRGNAMLLSKSGGGCERFKCVCVYVCACMQSVGKVYTNEAFVHTHEACV